MFLRFVATVRRQRERMAKRIVYFVKAVFGIEFSERVVEFVRTGSRFGERVRDFIFRFSPSF